MKKPTAKIVNLIHDQMMTVVRIHDERTGIFSEVIAHSPTTMVGVRGPIGVEAMLYAKENT